MTVVPMKALDDVILFGMQQENLKTATFSQIWGWCAATHLRHPDETKSRSAFAASLHRAIEALEQSDLLDVDRNRIGTVTVQLTTKGKEYLKHTIFSGQHKQ